MLDAIRNYFAELTERFGNGWNRFWFAPRDALTLSLVRVLTGLIALYSHATLSFDLLRFFGPHGLTPVDAVQSWIGNRYGFSYLNHLHEPSELWAAHFVGFVILLLFTVGLWTRVTSVLATLVVLSTIHRAPMLAGEFESVLAMVMVYLCIGASGDYLSVDYWLRRRRQLQRPLYDREPRIRPSCPLTTISTRLIQVHLTVVYVSMGISKLDGSLGDVWWGGTAIWWMLARPERRIVDLTGWLHNHIYIINVWTHATVLFELSFPLLVWNRLARPLMLVVATVMWILEIIASGLAMFGLTMIVANLVFVSPETLRSLLFARSAAEPVQARTEPTPQMAETT